MPHAVVKDKKYYDEITGSLNIFSTVVVPQGNHHIPVADVQYVLTKRTLTKATVLAQFRV